MSANSLTAHSVSRHALPHLSVVDGTEALECRIKAIGLAVETLLARQNVNGPLMAHKSRTRLL
jgi:hypothetical protein